MYKKNERPDYMRPLEQDMSSVPHLEDDTLTEPGADRQALTPFLSSIRRHLHQNPELGFEEYWTAAFIRRVLELHGLDVSDPVAETGLFVDIEGMHAGPSVGYRADIDALAAQDAKASTYASTKAGVAHLCGHDVHTAVAIGTAVLLHRSRAKLHGSVRVFFQPNEEGSPGGATSMIRAGVLDGLEAVYAIHVDPSLELGKYGLMSGPLTAATDQFRLQVRSRSTGHSARPHEAGDTIWVAVLICNALYQLVGRITDARNPAVLTICRFRAGEAYNVIPSNVEFGGTLRSTVTSDRTTLMSRIERLATEIGTVHGVEVDVEFRQGSPPVDNDQRLVAHLESTIRKVFGDEAVFHVAQPSMGAEDFAHYQLHVPGALLRVGTFSGPASGFPLHDAHFDVDERVMAPTAILFYRVLSDHLKSRILES